MNMDPRYYLLLSLSTHYLSSSALTNHNHNISYLMTIYIRISIIMYPSHNLY